MKLGLGILRYRPHGGLESNVVRIAHAARDAGHEVEVATTAWTGPRPSGVAVAIIPAHGLTNHGRMRDFARHWSRHAKSRGIDLAVAFQRLPGADVYYAGDVCYVADVRRRRGPWVRLTPRFRTLARLEREVFAPSVRTEILYLAAATRDEYRAEYATQLERFHFLPPGIDVATIRAAAPTSRDDVRRELGLGTDVPLLLMVGSDDRRKGVDRTLRAMAAGSHLPATRAALAIVGRVRERPIRRLARTLGITARVHVLGGRDDVARFLRAADLLVHPARTENTGNAILEALVAGLPVIATDNCGYAEHVRDAAAGVVVAGDPFAPDELARALSRALEGQDERERWRANALAYAARIDLGSRPRVAVAVLEEIAARLVQG